MHDCQRFREDWTAGLVEDFGGCEDCRGFCECSFGCEREPKFRPLGVEGFLDPRPLIGGCHRRISIMAAR